MTTLSQEKPFRQRFCLASGCGAMFFICPHCDRGQRYCSDNCRQRFGTWVALLSLVSVHVKASEGGSVHRPVTQSTIRNRGRRSHANVSARPALRRANVDEAKKRHGDCRAFTGAGHRREYGALQRRGCRAAQDLASQKAGAVSTV